MTDPDISVIIPHYNDVHGLTKCLAGLASQTVPATSFEIIVADNQSPVGIDCVRAATGNRAKLVVVPEAGAGPARNGGVASASGRVLAFIDSDCVPAPEWLEEGLKALNRFEVAGGCVRVSVDDERRLTPTEAFERVFAFNFKDYIQRKGFTGSGNMFVTRQVFENVGGFRAAVSEDVDWSRRATAAGYRISYAEAAVVYHPARRDWAELRSKWKRVNREMFALHAGAGGGRLTWVARALLLPASALAHSPRVLATSVLKSPRERAGALAILYRSRFWRLADSLKIAAGR